MLVICNLISNLNALSMIPTIAKSLNKIQILQTVGYIVGYWQSK